MFKICDYSSKLELVGKEDNYSLYEYIPTFIRPLNVPFEKLRLIRRLRFWNELFKGGYKVYYLAEGDIIVGHCVATPGGRRLKLSSKKDIVLGPYFVDSECRGKGYAKVLVPMTLKYCTYNYRYAFDWIHESNIPSIRTSEGLGMEVVGRLNVVGRFRKLVENSNGNYCIYKYDKNNK